MINIITTHFGDDFYIKALIKNLYEVQLLPQNMLYIINNSTQELIIRDKRIRILKFVNDLTDSRQHAAGLNMSIKKIYQLEGEKRFLVLDSDVLLKKNYDWHRYFISQSAHFDATLALERGSRVLTHPCFMYLDGIQPQDIDFLDGSNEFSFDTGRLIGYKLSKKYRVNKLSAEKNRQIKLGDFYQNGLIFHLGSASLAYMPSRVSKNSINRKLGINLRKQIHLEMLDKFIVSKRKKFKIFSVAIILTIPFIIKSKQSLKKVGQKFN